MEDKSKIDADYEKKENTNYTHFKNKRIEEYVERDLNQYVLLQSTGIEIYYLYLFLVFFAIPFSFVVLKLYTDFEAKYTSLADTLIYCGYIVFYSAFLFIMPIVVLKRKDVSLYHKKIVKIIIGNNIVLLIWLSVFILTPIILNIIVPLGKAKIAFLLYFILAIFDIVSQIFIASMKEKYPNKAKWLERLSLVLSIATIWGYGAIICPLVFSKRIERIIFDIALLAFVAFLSVLNLIVYKANKNKVLEDYKYNSTDKHKGRMRLIALIIEGIATGVGCIILMLI